MKRLIILAAVILSFLAVELAIADEASELNSELKKAGQFSEQELKSLEGPLNEAIDVGEFLRKQFPGLLKGGEGYVSGVRM